MDSPAPKFRPTLPTPEIMNAMLTLVTEKADPGVWQPCPFLISFTIKGHPMLLEMTTASLNKDAIITADNIPSWIVYTNSRGYKDIIPARGRHKVQTQLEKFIKEL